MKMDVYYYGQHTFNSLVFTMEKTGVFAHVLFSDLTTIRLFLEKRLIMFSYISFSFFFFFFRMPFGSRTCVCISKEHFYQE